MASHNVLKGFKKAIKQQNDFYFCLFFYLIFECTKLVHYKLKKSQLSVFLQQFKKLEIFFHHFYDVFFCIILVIAFIIYYMKILPYVFFSAFCQSINRRSISLISRSIPKKNQLKSS